jgi:XTP/dITP diphosphohydrolase
VRDLLVATNNAGKLAEFRRLLAPLPVRVVGPAEIGIGLEVPEPHDTYAENARDKAAAFCGSSGLVTLADDSGIEVAALGWGPGPRSARFGGPDLVDRAGYLLAQLDGADDRRARMVCWLALAIPDDGEPGVELFSGVMEGSVAFAPRGMGGFGYDPIFELPSGRTTAELPEGEKDRVSHRGRAVAAAAERISQLAWTGPDDSSMGVLR